jgi:hypothetical protein
MDLHSRRVVQQKHDSRAPEEYETENLISESLNVYLAVNIFSVMQE